MELRAENQLETPFSYFILLWYEVLSKLHGFIQR